MTNLQKRALEEVRIKLSGIESNLIDIKILSDKKGDKSELRALSEDVLGGVRRCQSWVVDIIKN